MDNEQYNRTELVYNYSDLTIIIYPMIQQNSNNPLSSELTLANFSFEEQKQNMVYQFEEVHMEEIENIQQKIESAIIQKYSIQQRKSLVVNKQTGEIFDVQGNLMVENILKVSQIKNDKSNWTKYWKEVSIIHQKFIAAAIAGDLNKLMNILDRSTNLIPIDVNFKSFDDWTAVHFSVLHGRFECLEFLIKNKANINQVTKFGSTPLHIAAKKNQINCTNTLLQNGADINAQDNQFFTPLHIASEMGFEQIVKILLKFGADQKIRNCHAKTPKQSSQNIHIFHLFQQNLEREKESYSKQIFGGVLLQNSRSDHIEKFLNMKKHKSDDPQKPDKKDKDKDKQKQKQKQKDKAIAKKFINIIKVYKTLQQKQIVSAKDFIFYKMIGKGSFGQVYLVKKNQQQTLYAMKVMNKEKIMGSTLAKYIKTEKQVLSLIYHPFIVRLYYSFQTQTKLFLVMQYCEGGDLSAALERKRKFSQQIAKIYIAQIILALEILHKNMIIYRDMKPQNIVIDKDGHVMLTDFGLSKKGEIDKINSSFCGTPAYIAPQILQKKGHNRMADWYELGIVLYQLLVGLPPFYASTKEELYKNKRQNILKIPKYISEDCRDLIKKLLVKNPAERLGAEKDGESIREHQWFKDLDWQKVYNRQLEPPKPQFKVKLGKPLNIKFQDGKPKENGMSEWTFVS